MRRLLVITMLALSYGAASSAQTRTWDRLSGGLWVAPENWSGGDVPDSLTESAVFDQFGSLLVTLPSSTPTRVDDFRVMRGMVRLISDSGAPASLEPSGDIVLGGDLTLSTDPIGGGVRLQGSGALELVPGSSLHVEDSEVSAAATSLGGNLLAGGSLIVAVGSAALDLGDLLVGDSGGGPDRVAVDVFNESTLAVNDLRIGADVADVFAEVNLSGTTLTQPAQSTTVVGRAPTPGEGGRGSLAVTGGGSAALGSLVVENSGTVVAAGGQITVASDFEVRDGGTYTTRVDIDAPLVASLTVGEEATLAGVLRFTLAPRASREFEAGDSFRVLEADSITGGFDTIDAPSLPAGLEWRTRQVGGVLDLLVTTPSVAGDFNFDGTVDTADYTIWRDTFGQRGVAPAADANNDGLVDELDFDAWRLALGGPAPEAASVPEPAALALLACVAAIHASRSGCSLRRASLG